MALVRRFRRDAAGATIIEFAVVAPVLFFLIFCIIELGLMMFTQVALESVTMQVSRSASLGTEAGCDRVCTVRNLVTRKTRGLIRSDQIMIEAQTQAAGGLPPRPDICLTDPPSVVSCAPSQRWFEVNGIPGFQGTSDMTGNSVGGPGDIVEIRVSYPWRTLIPFVARLYNNSDGVVLLSATTVLKNEPF